MYKLIKDLSIEITRRCNQKCKHCMRGEAQNIDISREYIDKLFSEEKLIIMNLNLSGGEPTLNEDIIEYIIDKIINERQLVLSLQMTTNGLIYSKRIIAAFEKFYDYVNNVVKNLYNYFELTGPYALIRISNDQYHRPTTNYQEYHGNVTIIYTGYKDVLDDEILLAGRAKNFVFGRYYDYRLNEILYHNNGIVDIFNNSFYLTATGYVTTNGDGEYNDMDIINLGLINDFTFESLKQREIKKLGVNLHN